MHIQKTSFLRTVIYVALTLTYSSALTAQSLSVAPSAESSPSRSVKQRLQILQHAGETVPTEAPASPMHFDPRSRDDAPQTSPLQAVRLPDSPIEIGRALV